VRTFSFKLFRFSAKILWLFVMLTLLGIQSAGVASGAFIPSGLQFRKSTSTALSIPAPIDPVIPRVYIPFIANGDSGIFGFVTLQGAPANNIPVDLWLEQGSTGTKIATLLTNPTGYFTFNHAATLAAGQSYRVRFDNSTPAILPNTLYHWKTKALPAFTAGQKINIGNFDIGDAALVKPQNFSKVNFPVTFTWTARTQPPGDSYQVRILDASTSAEVFLSANLGFVSSFKLNSLPPGMKTNTNYLWYVLINQPDGAMGTSYSLYQITFN